MPGRTQKIDGPHPVDVNVGKRLRVHRTLLGMSQEKLGDALGITFQQLQKNERGANRIGSSRLFELSRILDVPISYFFEEMDMDNPATDTPSDPMTKRETLELVRAYYRIKDPAIRKSIVNLTRAMAY